jgi:hypothetical protein
MTGLETVTAARDGLGIAWFVFNDGELSQIAQAQEMPYQRKTCTTVGSLNYQALAAATGCAFVAIDGDASIGRGIDEALGHSAAGRPVIVDVRIDYPSRRSSRWRRETNVQRSICATSCASSAGRCGGRSHTAEHEPRHHSLTNFSVKRSVLPVTVLRPTS